MKYARWYIFLTVVTLLGTALTPILLLYDFQPFPSFGKVFQALPSAIAGIAAAINTAFRYRESWAQNYYTLSSLINEYQKLIARASPNYGSDKPDSEVVDNFQNKMSDLVMAEVEGWRSIMLTSESKQTSAAQND